MALSEDQRAMLQLLLEGGQSYEDIAGLLGSDASGIRSRARDALAEMGGADPDAEVGLTDYLLGQADPIGRADAARHLQADPAANDLARRLAAQLRLLAPRAELPDIPEPRARGRAAPSAQAASAPPSGSPASPSAPSRAPSPPPERGPSAYARVRGALGGGGGEGGSLSGQQSRMLFGLGAAAVLVVAIVLGLTVFSGDDGGSGASSVPTGVNADVSVVPLGPVVPGSDAGGQAVIAAPGDQARVQLNLSGLEPSTGSDVYVAWLYDSDRISFPLGFFRANRDGDFSGPAPIPAQTLDLVRRFGCIDVSQVAGERVVRNLRNSIRTGSLPGHTGTSVLRGEITEPGQQATATGADSDCRGSLGKGGGGGAAGASP